MWSGARRRAGRSARRPQPAAPRPCGPGARREDRGQSWEPPDVVHGRNPQHDASPGGARRETLGVAGVGGTAAGGGSQQHPAGGGRRLRCCCWRFRPCRRPRDTLAVRRVQACEMPPPGEWGEGRGALCFPRLPVGLRRPQNTKFEKERKCLCEHLFLQTVSSCCGQVLSVREKSYLVC